MCEFSGRVIAWMDGEMAEREAADVERHVGSCVECGERLVAYRRASGAFDAYCEAIFAAETRGRLPRWVGAACGVGAIAAAAAIAVLLMLPRQRVAKISARPPAPDNSLRAVRQPPGIAPMPKAVGPTAAGEAVRPRRRAASTARVQSAGVPSRWQQPAPAAQVQNVGAFATEPPIEIAIPADAMFPPGALPEGMSFMADLTIAADGSTQRLGLRPRLTGFERRGNQP